MRELTSFVMTEVELGLSVQLLEEKNQQLLELQQTRDDLTHMIVHDLRTPLTSVLSGAQTVPALGELNEEQREFLDIVIGGGQTMLGMVNDLLDVSKMESGSLPLDYETLAAQEVVERAVQQVAPLAAEKPVTLTTEVAPDLPVLEADEDKLRRILVNLLGNAVKFTPTGGSIMVAAQRADAENALLFAVRDSGEGIPPESFERIFEKFGQVETRQAGRRMSTGLGLTFCKLAVEAHGGRIWVESTLGQGSTFLFTMPLQRKDEG